MVALSNGCICCTLREDLFVEIAKLASKPDGLDHILIESSGISEPLPVAETFTFKDAAGTSLGSIAKLDTLVTVVDGSSFMDELMAGGALKDRGWQAQPEDQRTIAQLFCDQVEFANVIVVNKCDLLDDTGRSQLHAFLKRANPKAKVVESTYGRVDPKQSYAASLLRRWRGGERSRRDSHYHAQVARHELVFSHTSGAASRLVERGAHRRTHRGDRRVRYLVDRVPEPQTAGRRASLDVLSRVCLGVRDLDAIGAGSPVAFHADTRATASRALICRASFLSWRKRASSAPRASCGSARSSRTGSKAWRRWPAAASRWPSATHGRRSSASPAKN
jgi:G3E family GTPase